MLGMAIQIHVYVIPMYYLDFWLLAQTQLNFLVKSAIIVLQQSQVQLIFLFKKKKKEKFKWLPVRYYIIKE